MLHHGRLSPTRSYRDPQLLRRKRAEFLLGGLAVGVQTGHPEGPRQSPGRVTPAPVCEPMDFKFPCFHIMEMSGSILTKLPGPQG